MSLGIGQGQVPAKSVLRLIGVKRIRYSQSTLRALA